MMCFTVIIQTDFLEQMERDAFLFFWEQTNASTGLVKDRGFSNGSSNNNPVASIACTGFSLSALVIAAENGFMDYKVLEERALITLRFVLHNLTSVHGFYYHFVDMNTGERAWACELSSIDTALLLCGVLTARQYFKENKEIYDLATQIYDNVDWTWLPRSRYLARR